MFGSRLPKAPVLLITSAINPAASHLVALDNPAERRETTIDAIDQWLRRLPNLRIVICDGSGFDFTDIVRERWPAARIESLSFVNDSQTVARLGKGFGEGQIIDHALRNSRLLRRQKYFMKCTGKLWVRNITRVLEAWTGGDNFTNLRVLHSEDAQVLSGYVDTRFFIVSRTFYDAYLRDAYQAVSRERDHFIEHEFGDRLVRLNRIDTLRFARKPKIRGVSGTLGRSAQARPPG